MSKTIADLMNYLKDKNVSLLDSDYITFGDSEDYLLFYNAFSRKIDIYFEEKYEDLLLKSKIENAIDNDNINIIMDSIDSVIIYNNSKYEKLYNTTILKYNPLDNVNATITTNYGAISNTKVKGQQTDTHERDAKTDSTTDNLGAVQTTRGANDITETNNIYGFNTTSANGVNADKKTINNGSYTDTIGQHTNTNTLNYGKDKLTEIYGNRSDTDSTQAHTDTITRVGNIGITSSQDLLKQEREVAIFIYFDYIFTDIIKTITTGVFNCEF